MSYAGPPRFPAPDADDADRWLHGGLEAADPALVAEGWERRFVTEGRRAEEFAGLYRQLGYDVRLEPVNPSHLQDDCSDCRIVVLLQFRAVYTRKPHDGGGDRRREAAIARTAGGIAQPPLHRHQEEAP